MDWCGCSPLAFHENDDRLRASYFREKMYFFGRKFDPLIDVGSIALVESQILESYQHNFDERITSSQYNSTWLNIYDAETDETLGKMIS